MLIEETEPKKTPETHRRMGKYILLGAQPGFKTGRVQHNLVGMSTAVMATGHMYVGETVLEGPITQITMHSQSWGHQVWY